MLNIIFAILIVYGIISLFSCAVNFIIQKLFRKEVLDYWKVIQISNAGLGASLMVTFLAMMFIPQFNVTPEEKTLYLFITFIVSYLLIVIFSFYSHLTFKPKDPEENISTDPEHLPKTNEKDE